MAFAALQYTFLKYVLHISALQRVTRERLQPFQVTLNAQCITDRLLLMIENRKDDQVCRKVAE